MAKKLKYPYEQWKQEKLERTPSPPADEEEQPMELTCYKQEIIAGKWCSMWRMLVYTVSRADSLILLHARGLCPLLSTKIIIAFALRSAVVHR